MKSRVEGYLRAIENNMVVEFHNTQDKKKKSIRCKRNGIKCNKN